MNKPLVSICVPAYKNTSFLKRLLESVLTQTYPNIEVIISDDSPDDSVKELTLSYQDKLVIRYLKNIPSLGTPANWNFSMQQGTGDYIKLIHDDDWLATPDALQLMVDILEEHHEIDFVFSAYNTVDLVTGTSSAVYASDRFVNLIRKNPLQLFRANIIGPPSVIMHRKGFSFDFDEKLKWVVDFEGYMRVLKSNHKFMYIDKTLFNIGMSSLQVTSSSSRIRDVEIPENLYLLSKLGLDILDDIWVYDYYWRLLRNVGIRNKEDIINAGWTIEIPQQLIRMLKWQKKIPLSILKIGLFSKLIMFTCYQLKKVVH